MKILFDAVPNMWTETSLGGEPAAARLVSWHTAASHRFFFTLKGSFYGKAGGQAMGNDPFEALIDPTLRCT